MPPYDPRYLEMTDLEIEEDFWTHKYFNHLEETENIPDLHEFDTEEMDGEIERWAREDEAELNSIQALSNPDEWEPIKPEQADFYNG